MNICHLHVQEKFYEIIYKYENKENRIFIQKCHNDNLIPFDNTINELLTSKYVHILILYFYYLERFLIITLRIFLTSYEEYYEYILYWLDYTVTIVLIFTNEESYILEHFEYLKSEKASWWPWCKV